VRVVERAELHLGVVVDETLVDQRVDGVRRQLDGERV